MRATPIADAFAQGRTVMPDAMALIRRLERERAECMQMLTTVAEADAEALVALEALGADIPPESREIGNQIRALLERLK